MSDKIHPSNWHLLENGVPAAFLETLGSLDFASVPASRRVGLFNEWKAKQGQAADNTGPVRQRAEMDAKAAAALDAKQRGDYRPAPAQTPSERVELARAEGRATPPTPIAPPPPPTSESDLPPGMRGLVGQAKIRALRLVQSIPILRAALAAHEDGSRKMSALNLAQAKSEMKTAWSAFCAAGGGNKI